MAFPEFPSTSQLPGTAYPSRHAPRFNNSRWESVSGKRTISPKNIFPRWSWTIPFSALRSAAYANGSGAYQELETLVGFFNLRQADGQCFSYEDPEDHTATNQGFGTGDGATTTFQLYRAFGGFSEPVYVADVTQIQKDAVTVDPGDYTVGDTGIVTFAVAPANGVALTWTGTFSFLCRFDDDSLDLERFMQGLSHTGDPISFSSEIAL